MTEQEDTKQPRWHRHFDVCCCRCGKLMWPRVTCICSTPHECLITEIALCTKCRTDAA